MYIKDVNFGVISASTHLCLPCTVVNSVVFIYVFIHLSERSFLCRKSAYVYLLFIFLALLTLYARYLFILSTQYL